MANEDGRKADDIKWRKISFMYIGERYEEILTRRGTPHPSAEEHHKEVITANAFVDFIDNGSVEFDFHQNRYYCQEDTDGEEGCSLSKLKLQQVAVVKRETYFVARGQQLSDTRRKVMQ